MLTVRLFAIVAAVLLVLAFLSDPHPLTYFTVASLRSLLNALAWGGTPGHMVLIKGFYARAWLALVCAVLAAAYFAVIRWAHRIPNRTGALVGFIVVAIGIIGEFAWNALTHQFPPPENSIPLFLPYALVYNAVSIGVIVSLGNLAWAFIPKRARQS